MTAPRRRRPEPDRTRRRDDWRDLAFDCRRAAAGEPGSPAVQSLAYRALKARDTWPWPLAWPEGLAFEALTVTARAWARASGSVARRRLAPALAATAEACLNILNAPPPAPAATAARLPYAED